MNKKHTSSRDRADKQNVSTAEKELMQHISSEERNLSSIKREQKGSMGELRSQIYDLQNKGMLHISEDEEQIRCRLSRRGRKLMEQQEPPEG